jgi:hypothetical protein
VSRRLSNPPSSAISLVGSCPPASQPSNEVPRQSLIYWRAVAPAIAITVLLIAGLVVGLSTMDWHARDRHAIGPLGDENATAAVGQPAEFTVQPALSLERKAEEEPTLGAIPSLFSDLGSQYSMATADRALDRVVSRPVCESYGTAVQFLSRPADAARQALSENKLLFVLHVSGNFEDAKFT